MRIFDPPAVEAGFTVPFFKQSNGFRLRYRQALQFFNRTLPEGLLVEFYFLVVPGGRDVRQFSATVFFISDVRFSLFNGGY